MAQTSAKVNEELKNKLVEKANGNKTPVTPEKSIANLLKKMEPEIQRALPKHLTADRLARIALTAVRQNPKLLACDQMSLLAAVMQSAQLGLEPNTPLGEAYIIPYGKEAQFQIGYKGLIALAYRTNLYQSIYAHEVYANDEFEFSYGLDKHLHHVPADIPQGEPVKYYAVYHLLNGGRDFVVWTVERVQLHAARYSKAYQKGSDTPWKSDFPSMAKKTVLKEVLKYAPKSAEFARALSFDETVKKEIAGDMSEVIDISHEVSVDDEPEELVNAEVNAEEVS